MAADEQHQDHDHGHGRPALFANGKPRGPVILFGLVVVVGVVYVFLRGRSAANSSSAGIPNTGAPVVAGERSGTGYTYSPSPVTQWAGGGPNSAPTTPPGPLLFPGTPNQGTAFNFDRYNRGLQADPTVFDPDPGNQMPYQWPDTETYQTGPTLTPTGDGSGIADHGSPVLA